MLSKEPSWRHPGSLGGFDSAAAWVWRELQGALCGRAEASCALLCSEVGKVLSAQHDSGAFSSSGAFGVLQWRGELTTSDEPLRLNSKSNVLVIVIVIVIATVNNNHPHGL